MSAVPASERGFDIVALGWGFAGALIVLYVLCLVGQLIAPDLPLAHGWLALFSTAPAGSVRGIAEGLIGSAVFGWIAAVALGVIYNRLLAGR